MNHRAALARAAFAAALVSAAALPAAAQAYDYPAFQPPRVTTAREFNFGLAGAGDNGTVLAGQWREPLGPGNQFGLDVGFASPDAGNVLFLGGSFGHQLATSSVTMPLDFMLNVGAGFAHLSPDQGNGVTVFRAPIGLVLGHAFPLQGSQAVITPFAQPRLNIMHCGDCGTDKTKLAIDFELGADFKFTPQLSGRVGARFGGKNDYVGDDAFGISLAWRPLGTTTRR